MPYTHTFEIKYNGDEVSGELELDTSGTIASIKYADPPEFGMVMSHKIQILFESVRALAEECGTLYKVEIVKKV